MDSEKYVLNLYVCKTVRSVIYESIQLAPTSKSGPYSTLLEYVDRLAIKFNFNQSDINY